MRSRFLRSMLFASLPVFAMLCTHQALAAKHPVLLGCQALPQTVHPGETVGVSATPVDADPNRPSNYTWQSTGGKITPSGARAAINTSGLADGEYTITGHISQGDKPTQQASCVARFRVIPFEPPSISCKPVPASGPTGTTFDIYAGAVSAQNRPLTVAYSASAGRITPSGQTARLSTKDVPAGAIKVSCYVVDDRGLSASALAQITVTKPALQMGQTSNTGPRRLCRLDFTEDRQHPIRVDALAEGCLDNIAYAARQSPGSTIVFVGNASPDEAPEASAGRALNARQYLTIVRGISPSHIQVLTGETSGRTVDVTLVPAGSAFSQGNTAPFDETLIPRPGEPFVPPASPRRRR
ncbi:MAG TPA: hypothetical protein VGN16_26055 [Acidobacteriaceae bacterium]|jgi:hypothetical protein